MGAGSNGECEALRRLSSLSRIPLSEEEFSRLCSEFGAISNFLSKPSEIVAEMKDVEPLYHPHEIEYEPLEIDKDVDVRIEDLISKRKLKERFVKIPWGVRS